MEPATNTETALGMKPGSRGRRAKGRKDEDKQEAVIQMEKLVVKGDELVKLYHAQETAATDFGEAIKATAEAAGLHAKNVRSWVIAKAGEKYEQKKEQVAQLALIFDEVASLKPGWHKRLTVVA